MLSIEIDAFISLEIYFCCAFKKYTCSWCLYLKNDEFKV